MEATTEYFDYINDYIEKLIDVQKDSNKLNNAASILLKGDYTFYDELLNLSNKVNQQIVSIMRKRNNLKFYNNMLGNYVN